MFVHVVQIGNLNNLGAYAGRSGFKSESAMHSTMRGYCGIIRSTLQLGAKASLLPGQVYANSQARHTLVQEK